MKLPTFQKESDGFTIIELLVVIFIFSAIAAFAVPQLSGTLSSKDLDNAAVTVAQAINKAKAVANSESTFVEIDFNGNVMSLKKLNTANVQKITLPKRVSVSSSNSPFRLNTIGNVLAEDEVVGSYVTTTGNTVITITSTTNEGSRVITVSPIGRVAS